MLPISSRPSSATLYDDATSDGLVSDDANERQDLFVWIGPQPQRALSATQLTSDSDPTKTDSTAVRPALLADPPARRPTLGLSVSLVVGAVILECAAASFCKKPRICPAWAATLASSHVGTGILPAAASFTLLTFLAERLARLHVEASRRAEQWLDDVTDLDESVGGGPAGPL